MSIKQDLKSDRFHLTPDAEEILKLWKWEAKISITASIVMIASFTFLVCSKMGFW